jgi:glycosyltransferase involved in cell wall biosynthesis
MIECNARELSKFFQNASAEIVIVNDYPGDNEQIVIASDNNLSVTIINHTVNMGIHKSRVDGLRASKGEYVLFLDQDDEIENDYLRSQLKALQDNDADWVICNGTYRGDKLIYENQDAADKAIDETCYFKSMMEIISPGQVLIRKSCIPDMWSSHILHYNYCDDAFLWMLLKDNKAKIIYNNRVLYRHNEDGGNTSFSWKTNADALRELRQVIIENDCLKQDNLKLFLEGVGKEITKMDSYAVLQESVDSESFKERLLQTVRESSVIIYGFGYWGKRLYDFLLNAGIKVDAVVDKAAEGYKGTIPVYKPEWLCDISFDKKKETLIFVAAPMDSDSIISNLQSWGFDKIQLISEI